MRRNLHGRRLREALMARDWTPTELAMMMRQGVRTPDQMYLGPGTASLGFADRNVNVNVRQPQAVKPTCRRCYAHDGRGEGLVNQGAWLARRRLERKRRATGATARRRRWRRRWRATMPAPIAHSRI